MFAGARMTASRNVLLGRETHKRSAVSSVRHKHGQTGHLLFVTVAHEYFQDGSSCLVEEQDIVYRSGGPTVAPRPHTGDLGATTATTFIEPRFDTATLFRYSALTSNSHRIHYDHPYATQVEHYPALVVHGPLLATLMANLAGSRSGPLRHFEFRLKEPVFLGDRVRIEATPCAEPGSVSIRIVSGHDTVHATALARTFCEQLSQA
ncbi:HTD2 family dehydratase [Gordonia sp. GN26]